MPSYLLLGRRETLLSACGLSYLLCCHAGGPACGHPQQGLWLHGWLCGLQPAVEGLACQPGPHTGQQEGRTPCKVSQCSARVAVQAVLIALGTTSRLTCMC